MRAGLDTGSGLSHFPERVAPGIAHVSFHNAARLKLIIRGPAGSMVRLDRQGRHRRGGTSDDLQAAFSEACASINSSGVIGLPMFSPAEITVGQYLTGIDLRRFISEAVEISTPMARAKAVGPPKS